VVPQLPIDRPRALNILPDLQWGRLLGTSVDDNFINCKGR
jgi:hypothetical protein